MSDQLDILICIVPKIMPEAPTVGPSLLKAHLEEKGLSCGVIDFNIKLYHELERHDKHRYYFFEDDSVFASNIWGGFETDIAALPDNFTEFCETYAHMFDAWIDEIAQRNPKWLGLSLLSGWSHTFAIKISELVRERLPHIKIVWGGAWVRDWTKKFVEIGLIDYYIYGDAEIGLVELLNGNNTFPGINASKPHQLMNLDTVLVPNYDDINWDEYVEESEPKPVYITGSRGCVKKCTFCDVNNIWPEYKFRSGPHIANEIRVVHEKYGRQTFRFTDSLVNGSMKAFRTLLQEITEFRKTHTITWSSQWIVRAKNQSPEEDYKLIAESGCIELEIGLESMSQDVRYHMGKKFTDEDMWWCFDMLRKYKIHHTLLMIIGYPTETAEDHQHTLNTLRRLQEEGYVNATDDYGNRLMYLSFGNTMMLHPELPLYNMIKDDLTFDGEENDFNWIYKDNTPQVRMKRFKEVNDYVKRLSNQDHSWLIKKTEAVNEKVIQQINDNPSN